MSLNFNFIKLNDQAEKLIKIELPNGYFEYQYG